MQEQKSILINQAVTRSLNPDAPMRDSGVEWRGKVPAHWRVKRGKYLFKEIDERSQSGTEELLSVVAKRKIGGQARAMIVCSGIARAIDSYREVSNYLIEIKSPYKAIVACSGEFEIGGVKRTEADLNDFPSKDIPARLKQDPYRFLIVANKFVTGFDEPAYNVRGQTVAGRNGGADAVVEATPPKRA